MITACPHCKGRGSKLDINIPMAIITFGITALADHALGDRKRCRPCAGTGIDLEAIPERRPE